MTDPPTPHTRMTRDTCASLRPRARPWYHQGRRPAFLSCLVSRAPACTRPRDQSSATAEAASTPGTVGRMAGLFVSFEGIDRSGKTTQARMLVDALGADAVPVREPGGTPLGERVRELLKDPGAEIGPHAEPLLSAAARAD